MNFGHGFGCAAADRRGIARIHTHFGCLGLIVIIKNDPFVGCVQLAVAVGVLKHIAVGIDVQGMDFADPVYRIGIGDFHARPENRLVDGTLTTTGGGDDRGGRARRGSLPNGRKGSFEFGLQLMRAGGLIHHRAAIDGGVV